MTHSMKIQVTKQPLNGGVCACRTVTIREKLLRFFLGTPQKLTVIVPGDTVDEIAITETAGKEPLHETV